MINNFNKLNRELEVTLNKILKIEDYDKSISEKDGIKKETIEKLVDMGYLTFIDASAFDGWSGFVNPTYDGQHYKEIKNEYIKLNIKEWIKFLIPVFISIAAFIKSFFY